MKRKIYVASSWRNEYYPEVVAKLREAGHDVYDFRNPPSGDPGFKWSSVSADYMDGLLDVVSLPSLISPSARSLN
jgi:hypothetical protein